VNYIQTSDLRCQGTRHFLTLSGPEPSLSFVPVAHWVLRAHGGSSEAGSAPASLASESLLWLQGHGGHVAVAGVQDLVDAGLLPDFQMFSGESKYSATAFRQLFLQVSSCDWFLISEAFYQKGTLLSFSHINDFRRFSVVIEAEISVQP